MELTLPEVCCLIPRHRPPNVRGRYLGWDAECHMRFQCLFLSSLQLFHLQLNNICMHCLPGSWPFCQSCRDLYPSVQRSPSTVNRMMRLYLLLVFPTGAVCLLQPGKRMDVANPLPARRTPIGDGFGFVKRASPAPTAPPRTRFRNAHLDRRASENTCGFLVNSAES